MLKQRNFLEFLLALLKVHVSLVLLYMCFSDLRYSQCIYKVVFELLLLHFIKLDIRFTSRMEHEIFISAVDHFICWWIYCSCKDQAKTFFMDRHLVFCILFSEPE